MESRVREVEIMGAACPEPFGTELTAEVLVKGVETIGVAVIAAIPPLVDPVLLILFSCGRALTLTAEES